MTPGLNLDIDRVVREVLDALAALNVPTSEREASAPDSSSEPDSSGASVSTPSHMPDVLRLTERVVSLDTLRGRLDGLQQISVQRGAVVTPSARDELHKYGVKLVVDETNSDIVATPSSMPVKTSNNNEPQTPDGENQNTDSTKPAVLIATMDANRDATIVAEPLQRAGCASTTTDFDCLLEATDRLADAIREGRTGLLLTRHVAAGVCLANRMEGVRAIAPTDIDALEKAAQSVGANLLIIDPVRISVHALQRMSVQFCTETPRTVPGVFWKRLG